MDKTNVENVMSIAFELARIREEHGAQSGMYLSEVRALRAEVERLAAQPSQAPVVQPEHDEGAALAHFEERFNEIEAGDGDIPLPQPRDGARWDEYVQRHQSALTGWELRREYEQLQRSVATAWDRFQKEMAAPVVQAGELTLQEVLETLKNFRLSNWTDDMGDGLPLVDRVTSGGTIGPGIEQLELLADEICVLFADRASSGATTQAVRMLTREELNDVALSDQVGWEPGEYIEAVQRKFCAVNAGRTIPASGEIGSV